MSDWYCANCHERSGIYGHSGPNKTWRCQKKQEPKMIKVVTAYETADGRVFTRKVEAEEHEHLLARQDNLLRFVQGLDEDDLCISDHYMDVEDLACWLENHASELKEIL